MALMSRTIAVLTTIIFLAACSATAFHLGNDFDANLFTAKIERSVTTQNQVRTWLGSPTSTGSRVETDGTQYDEWTYYFAAGKFHDLSSTQLKILQIKFDRNGIVQGYSWSNSTP